MRPNNQELEQMNDLYTTVRGVQIATAQIKQIEDEYGVRLVPDTEGRVLLALDRTLQEYRIQKGKDPDLVMLRETPELYYKHMVLNIHFMGMEIPGAYKKPAWFKMSKLF
jgi:hypothetical protein